VGPVKTQGPIFHIEGIKLGTYDRFIALAVKMLTRWGIPVYLRRNPSTLDPATGEVISGPIQEQTVVGIFVPNQWRRYNTISFLPGVVVEINDREVIVTAQSYDFEPTVGDQLVLDDGRAFDIIAMVPIDPGGSAIVYQLLVRR